MVILNFQLQIIHKFRSQEPQRLVVSGKMATVNIQANVLPQSNFNSIFNCFHLTLYIINEYTKVSTTKEIYKDLQRVSIENPVFILLKFNRLIAVSGVFLLDCISAEFDR